MFQPPPLDPTEPKRRGGSRKGAGRKKLDQDLQTNGSSSRSYSLRLPSYVEGIALNALAKANISTATPQVRSREVSKFVNGLIKDLLTDYLASPTGQRFIESSGWGDAPLRAKLTEVLHEKQQRRLDNNENVYEIKQKKLPI